MRERAKPGPKPKGRRVQRTLRAPVDHMELYEDIAEQHNMPLCDYLALKLAEAHDLPAPEYIERQRNGRSQPQLALGA